MPPGVADTLAVMDAWVIWLIAAVALAAGEIATTSFFLGPFAIGASAATIASLAGAGEPIAWLLFTVLTAASFAIVRPVARRHLRQPPHVRTGTAALIGRAAIVEQRISGGASSGTVKLEGEIWTARAFDEGREFEPGSRVQVIEIQGATALVSD